LKRPTPQSTRQPNLSGLDLKRGIDKAVTSLIDELKKTSKPCSTHKESAQVGSISANSDVEIDRIISEAMEKVGKGGVITVEDGIHSIPNSKSSKVCSLTAAFFSPYFINNPDKQVALMEDPFILLHGKKISNIFELWSAA
jgi:chaperonin GroEL